MAFNLAEKTATMLSSMHQPGTQPGQGVLMGWPALAHHQCWREILQQTCTSLCQTPLCVLPTRAGAAWGSGDSGHQHRHAAGTGGLWVWELEQRFGFTCLPELGSSKLTYRWQSGNSTALRLKFLKPEREDGRFHGNARVLEEKPQMLYYSRCKINCDNSQYPVKIDLIIT